MASNQLSWADPQDYLGNALGVPVTVTSGYRNPQHNAAVGGVSHSDHLTNSAYDFVPQGMSMADAAAKLKASGIPTTKIINENDHIHVSYPKGQMAQPALSDYDLLKSFVSGTAPKPASNSMGKPSPMSNLSDDQLLKSWATAKPTDNSAPPPKPSPPPAIKPAPANMPPAQPFGFMEDVQSKLPFAKDFAGAGAEFGNTLGSLLSGKGLPKFGEAYSATKNQLNAQQADYAAKHPNRDWAAAAASLLGGGGPSAAATKLPLSEMVKQGAKGGATLGAAFGLGQQPEGDDSLAARGGNALAGAGMGLVGGAALPVLGAGIGKAGQAVGKLGNKLFPPVEQVAANKAKAIVENFAGGGVSPNASEIVPGSKPTLAEATGNPGVASLHRALRDLNPNSPLISREADNAAARVAHIEQAMGSPGDLKAAESARDALAQQHLSSVFSSSAPVKDTAPITEAIDSVLNGKSGARPAVKSAMADVKAMLAGPDGKTINDPETLYHSVRMGINDLISGKDLTKGYGAQAAAQLKSVRGALDDVIENGAPGFKDYLKNYSEASTPIDSMKFLQGLNLTDNYGKITLSKVQSALKSLKAQKAAAGVKQGKAVTDSQQAALENIRDDLQRAGNTSLGKAIGSNTVQNAMNQRRLGISKHIDPELVGKGIGSVAGGGIGSIFGPGGMAGGGAVGASLGGTLGRLAGNRAAAKNALLQSSIQQHLEEMMLNPGHYQAPTTPSVAPSLNEIMNSGRARASLGLGNRLVVESRSKRRADSR